MNYCKRCIIPDTRPNVTLDSDGICNACRSFESRSTIDWSARKVLFEGVVENAKSKGRGYDCLIPVSGGKDSHWQVIKCLEYGMKPLCVTWKTPVRTEIGRRNLENLIRLGVDHIDFQVSPATERIFLRKALERFGSTAIPMHMAIFNIPVNIALRFGIPLIIWGENSSFEYGGTEEQRMGFRLDRAWFQKYGVTHGTVAADWVDDELTQKQLTPYFGPSDEAIEAAGLLAVFLGYYFPWDPETSLAAARASGFESAEGPRTGFYNYADIDDDFISIHHYLKWYKFGFTRLFDNLSLEIRNGRMTRDQAIEILREAGEQKPAEDIKSFCRFTGLTEERCLEIFEGFRNLNVWEKSDGVWKIREFLIPDWNWK